MSTKKSVTIPILRLVSGLIVMFYTFGHLINHALGLISIEVMESYRVLFGSFWRSPLLYWVVPVALLVHIFTAVWALLMKKTLKDMTKSSIIQTVLGILIPFLLFQHMAATRYVYHKFEIGSSYPMYYYVSYNLPEYGEAGPTYMKIMLILMLLFIWYHSCMGLDRWLKLKEFYNKIWTYWYSLALLTPVLSILGFLSGFKEYDLRNENENNPLLEQTLLKNNEQVAAYCSSIKPADISEISWMDKCITDVGTTLMNEPGDVGFGFFVLFVTFVLGGFAIRAVYLLKGIRKQTIKIEYSDGQEVKISEGTTVLEASYLGGIPHASICGGNGRCSTCRIRIIKGEEFLAPPSEEETRILKKISAPPNVRLACQVKPKESVRIQPILTEALPSDGYERAPYSDGEELEVTILFADLRGFTKMSDKRLPYDVVFILNQYFELMGEAIESKDGYLDKFIGDGIMAIFGIRSGAQNGARQAIGATMEMSRKLSVLNKRLEEEVSEPLRIGIGVHSGKAIIGAMGYGNTKPVTAIGSTVNTAARLEGESKKYGAELILSQEVLDTAMLELEGTEKHEITVRGREDALLVHVVQNASELKPQKRKKESVES
jgi:adenylate cyclase